MDINSWITGGDKSALLKHCTAAFSDAVAPSPSSRIIIDSTQLFQPVEGFGFSLTDGSALLINKLEKQQRTRLLQELFGTGEGCIGINVLRLSLGASDLSTHSYSYNDMPKGATDPTLARFNLHAGDDAVIPLLKEILAINPAIMLLATPWSAPAWMKTNESTVGGELKPEYYDAYAHYIVKYLLAMKAEGITIHALTPQNEPLNNKNDPSMVMTAESQADFIKNHLGSALKQAGLDTQIVCWDHNCDVPEYPLHILNDTDARAFVSGVAWHLYGGTPEAIEQVHLAHPDKKAYFTEQWVGSDGKFDGDLNWHGRHVLIGTLRHWSRMVLEWNLASDPQCKPHTAGGEPRCVGALTIDGDKVTRNVAYYIIAHASKFVPVGSERIASTAEDGLPNVAFKTPDGGIALIVLNDSNKAQSFTLEHNGKTSTLTLAAGSLATYTWQTTPFTSVPLQAPRP